MNINNHSETPNHSVTIPDSVITSIDQNSPVAQLIIKSICYTENDKTIYKHSKSQSKNYTLVYNKYGSGFSRLNNKLYQFNKDNIILISSDINLEYGSNTGCSIYRLNLIKNNNTKLFDNVSIDFGIPIYINNAYQNIETLLNTILSILKNCISEKSLNYCSMICWHLFGNILYHNLIADKPKENSPVADCISYMNSNLNKELTLDELSHKAGYSPSHFCNIFKEEVGESPISYFINLKMHLASEYLIHTNKSIKEISYILGYSSQYYFSRLFKTHIGISPLEYRNKQRHIN